MEIGLVPSGNDPKCLLAAKRSPSNYMEASPLLSPLPAGRRAYLGAPDMLEPWVRRLAGLPIFCPPRSTSLSHAPQGAPTRRLRGEAFLRGSWPPCPHARGRPFLAGQRDPAAVRGGAAGADVRTHTNSADGLGPCLPSPQPLSGRPPTASSSAQRRPASPSPPP